MSETSQSVLNQALTLSAEERLAVAARLLESVEGSIDEGWDAAWLDELRHREAEPEVDADEAVKQARASLKPS